MSSINPEFLLQAYRMGIFPMAMEQGEIGWFSPDPRGIIPLESFHQTKSLKRVVASGKFEIRIKSSFSEVIDGCAERDETWIDETVRESYMTLKAGGYAHSVESWSKGELVGGLYGVSIGGAFFGESMFSREANASKVALVALGNHLRKRNFILLDTQWTTPHLRQFGAVDIPKNDYIKQLNEAIRLDVSFV